MNFQPLPMEDVDVHGLAESILQTGSDITPEEDIDPETKAEEEEEEEEEDENKSGKNKSEEESDEDEEEEDDEEDEEKDEEGEEGKEGETDDPLEGIESLTQLSEESGISEERLGSLTVPVELGGEVKQVKIADLSVGLANAVTQLSEVGNFQQEQQAFSQEVLDNRKKLTEHFDSANELMELLKNTASDYMNSAELDKLRLEDPNAYNMRVTDTQRKLNNIERLQEKLKEDYVKAYEDNIKEYEQAQHNKLRQSGLTQERHQYALKLLENAGFDPEGAVISTGDARLILMADHMNALYAHIAQLQKDAKDDKNKNANANAKKNGKKGKLNLLSGKGGGSKTAKRAGGKKGGSGRRSRARADSIDGLQDSLDDVEGAF